MLMLKEILDEIERNEEKKAGHLQADIQKGFHSTERP